MERRLGRIVLAVLIPLVLQPGRASAQFALARYSPDGSLDTTFDGDGKVITDSRYRR